MPAASAAAASASPIAFGFAYASAVPVVVQVVELPDRRHPGQHHLGEDGPGEREVAVRVEPLGHGVHLLRARSRRSPRRRGCGRAGRDGRRDCARWRSRAAPRRSAARRPGLRARPRARTRRSRLAVDREPYVGAAAVREPGPLRPVARHAASRRDRPTPRSGRSTPARQSSRSACSAGEWRHPGRVAHEDHGRRRSRPRRGCRRRARRRCRARGASGRVRPSRSSSAGSKRVAGGPGLLGDGAARRDHHGRPPRRPAPAPRPPPGPGRPARRPPSWGSR